MPHMPLSSAALRMKCQCINVSSALQDEVFHVPQAQRYCAGRVSDWDSKITTLPGAYVPGAVLLGAASLAISQVRRQPL